MSCNGILFIETCFLQQKQNKLFPVLRYKKKMFSKSDMVKKRFPFNTIFFKLEIVLSSVPESMAFYCKCNLMIFVANMP